MYRLEVPPDLDQVYIEVFGEMVEEGAYFLHTQDRYVELANLRFNESLRITVEVDGATYSYEVTKK